MKLLSLLLYLVCAPLANWMVFHIGMCAPTGPCVVPVGFGLYAPSGVLLIGIALCLRDAVREVFGWRIATAGALVASVLSALTSSTTLAVASTSAFCLSELLDSLVYERFRSRDQVLAMLTSGAAGLVMDSYLFLYLAFGSLQFLEGQILGKAWAVVAASACAHLYRKRRAVRAV
jgi:uncharacterized PurR-regulated membrane protein YhhQ (DUF165 family)